MNKNKDIRDYIENKIKKEDLDDLKLLAYKIFVEFKNSKELIKTFKTNKDFQTMVLMQFQYDLIIEKFLVEMEEKQDNLQKEIVKICKFIEKEEKEEKEEK